MLVACRSRALLGRRALPLLGKALLGVRSVLGSKTLLGKTLLGKILLGTLLEKALLGRALLGTPVLGLASVVVIGARAGIRGGATVCLDLVR